VSDGTIDATTGRASFANLDPLSLSSAIEVGSGPSGAGKVVLDVNAWSDAGSLESRPSPVAT